MKKLFSLIIVCGIAAGGAGVMGCHASGSIESNQTPHDTKSVTTYNNATGEKTTKTETKTYPQNPSNNGQ